MEESSWKVWDSPDRTGVISGEGSAVGDDHCAVQGLPQKLDVVPPLPSQTFHLLLQIVVQDIGGDPVCLLEVDVRHQEPVEQPELRLALRILARHRRSMCG